MERRRKPIREPRCGLCLSCANGTIPEGRGSGPADVVCVAGADPRGALFECDSFVRVFTRAPHLPAGFRRANR